MTETWCPFAIIERQPYDNGSHGGPINTPVHGIVEHVTTNLFDPGGFFSRPANQASSTFWLRTDGVLIQFLPLEVASWAQSAGNYDYWSIETDGTVDVALTDAQVKTFGHLYAWLQALPISRFGFDEANSPGERGLGWHGMGTPDWGHAECPGPIRKAQRADVLNVAQGGIHSIPVEVARMAFGLVDFAIDPTRPVDHAGRLPFWGVDCYGRTYALNGARQIPSPIHGHADIVGIEYVNVETAAKMGITGDFVVIIADDGRAEAGEPGGFSASAFVIHPT